MQKRESDTVALLHRKLLAAKISANEATYIHATQNWSPAILVWLANWTTYFGSIRR